MLNIVKNQNGDELTVALEGRLDTTTAPDLAGSLEGGLEGVKTLVLDLKDLEYISSAGLRVILSLQKTMAGQGEMKVVHLNEIVREVFEVTGFGDILTIE